MRVQTVGGLQQHLVHTFLGRRPDEPDVVGQRARARAAAAQEPDPTETEPVEEGGPQDPGYADELPPDLDDDPRPADEGPGADDGPTPPGGTPRVD